MIQVQKLKILALLLPLAIANNTSPATNVVDTKGWKRATFIVTLGATDIALTALKLQESDAITNATTLNGGTDVTGAIFGTSLNNTGAVSTLPSATDDNKLFCIDVDLRGRKRYLDLLATIGNGAAGAFLTVHVILSNGEATPCTATDRGYAQELTV